MKQLFYFSQTHGDRDYHSVMNRSASEQFTKSFYSIALQKLWSEFEGLANGLVFVHDYCNIVHSDIKPSNILLYETHGNEPVLVAKLTDFGMAVNLHTKLSWRLGSQEARSAYQYDAPEIRNYYRERGFLHSKMDHTKRTLRMPPSELMKGDVWKLGSVFVELLTFLVKGDTGVSQFRKFITTTHRELTSDNFSDTRFDDGKQVKPEVLAWLSQLATLDPRAQEIGDTLRSMLAVSDGRPSALEVSQALKKSSVCLHFDGMRYLNFTQSRFVRPPCAIDHGKELVEKWVGHQLDWRPFHNGYRRCPPGYSRISWLWSNSTLYIDVPDSLAQAYKDTCRPISCFTQPTAYVNAPGYPHSSYHSSRGDYSQNGIDLASLGKEPALRHLPSRSTNQGEQANPSAIDSFTALDIQQTQKVFKEIYWCVDKAWAEPRVTKVCHLQERPYIFDDISLCYHLLQEYNRIRTLRGRFLSWKSCLGVEFIRFCRIGNGNDDDVMKVQIGLPPSVSKSYEYILKSPEEVHMMIAATQLIDTLHHPGKRTSGDDRTLRMIPKRIMAARLGHAHRESEDWGMHAQARFSLWKILAWMASLTVLGFVFVICWLVLVSKTDLQNAFIPFMFLGTTMMVGLGVPQFLEVD